MALLRTTAVGAAVASAYATGGVSTAVGAAAVAGILAAVGVAAMAPSGTSSSGGRSTAGTGNPLPKITSGGAQRGPAPKLGFPNNFGAAAPSITTPSADRTLQEFLKALNKNTTATVKNTKSVMDIATENARKELAARQKALSGSASIAIGGAGSKIYGPRGATTVIVNNQGSVISNNDLVTSIVNGIERTTRRSFGTVGAFDR
jgi:hypothetical protein